MKMQITNVVIPCPLLRLGLYSDAQGSPQEVFYTTMLHILYIIRVRIPLVDLVLVHQDLVHLDVAIKRDYFF